MQKSAVATQPPARLRRQPSEPTMDKGRKFESFSVFGIDRRSPAWLEKADRKR